MDDHPRQSRFRLVSHRLPVLPLEVTGFDAHRSATGPHGGCADPVNRGLVVAGGVWTLPDLAVLESAPAA